MEPIEQTVKEIIADQLSMPLSEIKDDSHLADNLGMDSLESVELIMALEEQFDFGIKDEDAKDLTTVEAVVKYVRLNIREKKR